nr:immunoglobulin heavy chain junction region [Macaca mulatta]MOX92387.1 immunoglobulin heavy chain junction region [Macaca mulatta]
CAKEAWIQLELGGLDSW